MSKKLTKKEELKKQEQTRIEYIRSISKFDLKETREAKRLWHNFVFHNIKIKKNEITDFVLRWTSLLKYEVLEQDVRLDSKEAIFNLARKCDFENIFDWNNNIESDKFFYDVLEVVFKCWKYGSDLEYVLTEYF